MVESIHRAVKRNVLAALLALMLVGIVGIDAYQKLRRQPGPPSTYNAGSAGYKALYLWLREMGVPAERWERPLTELTQKADVILTAPPRFDPGPDELKALNTWVRGGGTAVFLLPALNEAARGLGKEMSTVLHEHEKGQKAMSFQPGPYIRGQRNIISGIRSPIDSSKPEAIAHSQDAFGNLIVVREEGKGRVIEIADPSLFSNLRLRQGDHARLALDVLLTHFDGGLLLIDEYHQGYGRVNSLAAYVFQSEAFVPLLQVLFLLLLLLGAAGRRFGPARPPKRETERSSMEYVRAVAHLFHRVKARRLALESVLRWFDEETRRLLLDKDPSFQRDLSEAKKRLSLETMTDRDLVSVVRKLYGALARARKSAF